MRNYALNEFKVLGWIDDKGNYVDEMQESICKNILEVIGVFSNEGHSGFSASYSIGLLTKLLNLKPISPLKLDNSEWFDTGSSCGEGITLFQNRRNSAIFKNGINGRAYSIDAFVMYNPEVGSWNGCINMVDGKYLARCYIRNGGHLPTLTIPLDIIRKSESDWEFVLCEYSNLSDLEKFYDLDFKGEK
jgi:hypothetical protein